MDEVNPPTLQQDPADNTSGQAEEVNIVPAPQQDRVEDGDGGDDDVLPVLQQPRQRAA